MKQVTRAETWLKQHERIIITVFVLAVVLFLGNKYLNKTIADTNAKYQAAQQALVLQQQMNQQLIAQMQQADAGYKASLDNLNKTNASIVAAMAQRQTILVEQQKQDAAMTPNELTQRWAGLIGVSTSDVTTNSIDYLVTDTAARKTVNSLEEIPVLQKDKQDLQTNLDTTRQTLTACSNDLDKTKAVVVGLQNAAKDQDNACKTQIKAIKAVNRKAKIKWFLYGYGTGFVSGVITTAIGISHL